MMCVSQLAATTLDVLTYVPVIGTGVSLAVQAEKCLIGIECGASDLAMTALGAIPGGKIAGKAGKWLSRGDSFNISAAKEAMWAARGGAATDAAQGGLTGWSGAKSVHTTYTTYSGRDPLAYNGGGWS
jgi:hypothetical protein